MDPDVRSMPEFAALSVLALVPGPWSGAMVWYATGPLRLNQASVSRRGRFLVESARGAPRGSGGQLGPPSTSAPPAPGPSSPTRPGNHINPTDTDASPTGGSANCPRDPRGSPRLPTWAHSATLRARFARGDRPRPVLASGNVRGAVRGRLGRYAPRDVLGSNGDRK